MKPDGFQDIPGCEGRYAAHPSGLIYSYGFKGRGAVNKNDKNPQGKMVVQMLDKKGYFTIMFRDNRGVQRRRFVHQLILETFVGPRPDGHEVDHINRDPADNRADNLRWVTKSMNMRNMLGRSKCSKYRGLGFDKKGRRPWFAKCVALDGTVHCVRGFTNDRDAAIAYDSLATGLLGPLAITNKSLGLL